MGRYIQIHPQYESNYMYIILECLVLLPPPWRRLCFHRCPLLVCLSVCLSVSNIMEKQLNRFHEIFICLSVSNIMEKQLNRFHEIFRVGGTWCKEQLGTFSGFSWNFQRGMDMTQGAIWNIFGMLRLTPWILGQFIYFLDPCLFVIFEFFLRQTINNKLDCFKSA